MAAPAWDDTSGYLRADPSRGDNFPYGEPYDRHHAQRSFSFGGSLDAERERFFLWLPVCFAVGIASYFALPREPELWIASLPFFLTLIIRLLVARGSIAAVIAIALTLMSAGFLAAKVRVEIVRAPVLEKPMTNVDVVGTMTRIEPKGARGARVTLRVTALGNLAPDKIPYYVRVRVLRKEFSARPGDILRVKATLAPPAKPPFPGGFDYARAAWFDQIGGVGYSYAVPEIARNDAPQTWREKSLHSIETLRLAIDKRIKAALPGERGAIASALITGERGDISAETNDAFRDSGLFHILSISGLHMVVMAGAVFYALRLLLAAFPLIVLRFPIKKWAAVAGIAAALVYLAISGAAFATVRAAIMITIVFGAVLLDRPALALRNVALSAFVILLIYPESLFDAGFQMSFAAVTGLVATYEAVRKRMARRDQPHPVLRVVLFFGGIVFSTLIASAAVAPFAAYHFHKSQQYAVLANLAAIPICNLFVMPAALLVLVLMPFGLENVALWPMGLGIEAMTWCAEWVAKLPGAVGNIPAIPSLSFALMVMGGLWLALWQTRLRVLGVMSIAAGLALAPLMPRPDILIAKNGELVAVRGDNGLLSALPARQSKFELEKWLEIDGDGRSVKEASNASAFRCDGTGCVATVKSVHVSVAQHPAAMRDDCSRGDVVVLAVPRPREGCAAKNAVVDLFDVWRHGTHAIYIMTDSKTPRASPTLRIDTVAEHRGVRPWAPLLQQLAPKLPIPRIKDGTPDGVTANAFPKFAARPEFLTNLPPRPEIEDDVGDVDAEPKDLSADGDDATNAN